MYLGLTYRIAYESKNFVSGLTNILAMILKPNGQTVGPFTLSEVVGTGFTGVYSYNYLSNSDTDPEGEYLAVIVSPTDNIRDFKRFTLVERPENSQPGPTTSQVKAVAHVMFKRGLKGSVRSERIQGKLIKPPRLKASVPNSAMLQATLRVKNLRGEIIK